MSLTKNQDRNWPILSMFPIPAKALVTAVILTIAAAMSGAMGQIIVHDIIPTFFSSPQQEHKGGKFLYETQQNAEDRETGEVRGDLFSEESLGLETDKKLSFFHTEQFVWTLKWTHIHLFGINMIFIFMGVIVLFMNISTRWRFWLIVLPFLGVFFDIATIWLKAYVSPAFFWLHIPGGGLFGVIFTYVGIKALWEMWGARKNYASGPAG